MFYYFRATVHSYENSMTLYKSERRSDWIIYRKYERDKEHTEGHAHTLHNAAPARGEAFGDGCNTITGKVLRSLGPREIPNAVNIEERRQGCAAGLAGLCGLGTK